MYVFYLNIYKKRYTTKHVELIPFVASSGTYIELRNTKIMMNNMTRSETIGMLIG
jgi:hypothetical protein